MTSAINRRELLKMGLLPPFAYYLPKQNSHGEMRDVDKPRKNILIVVFDALAVKNINFYGYARQTMPNLTRLLEKATVYHKHFASGPFTTPGTASLLTGTYPWKHRALRLNSKVTKEYEGKNIFTQFPDFHRFAYTQNPVANVFLRQFQNSIDNFLPQSSLYLNNDWVTHTFNHDYDIATLSEQQIFNPEITIRYSLLFSDAYNFINQIDTRKVEKEYQSKFPRGIPHHGSSSKKYFTIETPVDWLLDTLPTYEHPFLGYFHFLPPHGPYDTRVDFFDTFANDGIAPLEKPDHFFSTSREQYNNLVEQQRYYDEFILYVDAEFNRLYRYLEEQRVLENTILVFTSDHGEMFERKILGHNTYALFRPVVQIPLIIFYPGQQERVDIHTNTSAVDVLPTLLHLSGSTVPNWCEGEVLPPYNGNEADPAREVFAMRSNALIGAPMEQASLMLVKDNYKYTKYIGFAENKKPISWNELYDINQDPEELTDLSQSNKNVTDTLERILDVHFREADQPFK